MPLALMMVGCVAMPDAFIPQSKRRPLENVNAALGSAPLIEMGDSRARVHIVKDIQKPADNVPWAWTYQRPTLRYTLNSTTNWKLVADYTVPEITLLQTGPVTISFFVNDRAVEQVRIEHAGQMHLEHAIPQDWLRANEKTTIAAEIDKLYDPGNGTPKLGFILTRLGFAH